MATVLIKVGKFQASTAYHENETDIAQWRNGIIIEDVKSLLRTATLTACLLTRYDNVTGETDCMY